MIPDSVIQLGNTCFNKIIDQCQKTYIKTHVIWDKGHQENKSLIDKYETCIEKLLLKTSLIDQEDLFELEFQTAKVYQNCTNCPIQWGRLPTIGEIYRLCHPEYAYSIRRYHNILRICIHAKRREVEEKKHSRLSDDVVFKKHLNVVHILDKTSSSEFMDSLFNEDVTRRVQQFQKEMYTEEVNIHKMFLWLKLNHYLHPISSETCNQAFLRMVEKELNVKLIGDLKNGFSLEIPISNSMKGQIPKIHELVCDPTFKIHSLTLKHVSITTRYRQFDGYTLMRLIDTLMPNLKELIVKDVKFSRPIKLFDMLTKQYPSLKILI